MCVLRCTAMSQNIITTCQTCWWSPEGVPQSGTNTLAADPSSPVRSEVEPPWIRLGPAHPTDAQLDRRLRQHFQHFFMFLKTLPNNVCKMAWCIILLKQANAIKIDIAMKGCTWSEPSLGMWKHTTLFRASHSN